MIFFHHYGYTYLLLISKSDGTGNGQEISPFLRVGWSLTCLRSDESDLDLWEQILAENFSDVDDNENSNEDPLSALQTKCQICDLQGRWSKNVDKGMKMPDSMEK